MAFGINKNELKKWKKQVKDNQISFLTHFWLDERFPKCDTVTKVGCANISTLAKWGEQYGLKKQWIHNRDQYPHYDLFGNIQKQILIKEQKITHLERFSI